MKYIVITGGVISGLGKGITASSIGLLLKDRGYMVTSVKIDPYLNVDAGTMSPYEHGEVYVLRDGTETDLDLGNYERFLDIQLRGVHNITSGKVFQQVIQDERRGKYMGQTIQFVPHVTQTIQDMIHDAAHMPVGDSSLPQICIVELGGTVGDIESMHFLEALRQMKSKLPPENMCFLHVSLLLHGPDEKTKPTQHCVQTLRKLGIFPDVLVLRADVPITEKTRQKLHLHCQVPPTHIFTNPNVRHVYEVPLRFDEQQMLSCIEPILGLTPLSSSPLATTQLSVLQQSLETDTTHRPLQIAMVGKYVDNPDTYLSIHRAIEHAAFIHEKRVNIVYVSSETVVWDSTISAMDGIVIPGGFGERGLEGMISIAEACRTHDVPLLGICLGMQMMCIAAARKQSHYGKKCNTYEVTKEKSPTNVVIPMEELDQTQMGGTMRLGLRATHIRGAHTRAATIYQDTIIHERHRHRYEINPAYRPVLEKNGLTISGTDETDTCVHLIEDSALRFYVGCQYHPEYENSLRKPSKLFVEFVKKASNQ